jgi:hypothetical protein
VITTLAVDLGSTAEERRRCRGKVRGVRACPSILESPSLACVLAGSGRVRRPALNRSAPVDRPHAHLGSVISSSANAGCPLPNAASQVVAAIVIWTRNLLLMLYRVADQLRTILFIPDPFGRLLRTSMRCARICSSSNSCHRAQIVQMAEFRRR